MISTKIIIYFFLKSNTMSLKSNNYIYPYKLNLITKRNVHKANSFSVRLSTWYGVGDVASSL
jgi:hypothetical protein